MNISSEMVIVEGTRACLYSWKRKLGAVILLFLLTCLSWTALSYYSIVNVLSLDESSQRGMRLVNGLIFLLLFVSVRSNEGYAEIEHLMDACFSIFYGDVM